jgi:hypothetical protein
MKGEDVKFQQCPKELDPQKRGNCGFQNLDI